MTPILYTWTYSWALNWLLNSDKNNPDSKNGYRGSPLFNHPQLPESNKPLNKIALVPEIISDKSSLDIAQECIANIASFFYNVKSNSFESFEVQDINEVDQVKNEKHLRTWQLLNLRAVSSLTNKVIDLKNYQKLENQAPLKNHYENWSYKDTLQLGHAFLQALFAQLKFHHELDPKKPLSPSEKPPSYTILNLNIGIGFLGEKLNNPSPEQRKKLTIVSSSFNYVLADSEPPPFNETSSPVRLHITDRASANIFPLRIRIRQVFKIKIENLADQFRIYAYPHNLEATGGLLISPDMQTGELKVFEKIAHLILNKYMVTAKKWMLEFNTSPYRGGRLLTSIQKELEQFTKAKSDKKYIF